ncbi:MAG: UV DNA damage repair endonuclease UvsE [Candidatus Rifleibacteriota bacterium]
MRFGLCCMFKEQPIKFSITTARSLSGKPRSENLKKLSLLCLNNARSLLQAFKWCHENGIGDFRIVSQILPLKTHPEAGYEIRDLPDYDEIVATFRSCGDFSRKNNFRSSLHPDQFVILSSPDQKVVANSLAEIEYQTEIAQLTGADVINIHGGGAYGDKSSALERFAGNFRKLSPEARSRLTLENDDKIYTPSDLLPLCKKLKIPLVYDVHHHRCLPDSLTEKQATEAAIATWNREPMFHVSSPRDGWQGPKPSNHHDFIAADDFPAFWKKLDITVEIEAKAKEIAVKKLIEDLKT